MSKRILVIDDELDIRDVVCLSLEEFAGYQLKPGQVDRTRDWAVVTKKTV
jgi:CheY-like chemotaxis protein